MTMMTQLKAAQQLIAESLRVAWKEKWLWGYSSLTLGTFVVLFGLGALLVHFINAVGPWYLWLAPELQVPFSITQVTVKVFFVSLVALINAMVMAVITYQVINRLNRTSGSFISGFRLQGAVWRRVLAWAVVIAISTLLTVIPVKSLVLHGLCWIIGDGITIAGLLVIPGLVKDGLSLRQAFVRSVQLLMRFFVLVLWAFILYVAIIMVVFFVAFVIAMVIAKLLGLIFAWSPFVTLVPFALIGGGLMAAILIYLLVVWAIFLLRAYSYLTVGVLDPF